MENAWLNNLMSYGTSLYEIKKWVLHKRHGQAQGFQQRDTPTYLPNFLSLSTKVPNYHLRITNVGKHNARTYKTLLYQ